jgi:hypothetical protein
MPLPELPVILSSLWGMTSPARISKWLEPYRDADGEPFQLPLAWYTQEGRWGMAPGYDRPDHEGVLRRVRRECLFCHNGYPEVAAGSDAYGAPQTYPEKLPEWLGCRRCHGPGGEHVRRASGGTEPKETIRAANVNPARLSGTLGPLPLRKPLPLDGSAAYPRSKTFSPKKFALGADFSLAFRYGLSRRTEGATENKSGPPSRERFWFFGSLTTEFCLSSSLTVGETAAGRSRGLEESTPALPPAALRGFPLA